MNSNSAKTAQRVGPPPYAASAGVPQGDSVCGFFGMVLAARKGIPVAADHRLSAVPSSNGLRVTNVFLEING